MISEFEMGEGQVPRWVKHHTLSSAFFTARNDIHFSAECRSVWALRTEREGTQTEVRRDLQQVSFFVFGVGNYERDCALNGT